MEVVGLSAAELAIGLTALVAGACLQGSLGFGMGLVGAPVLVLLDPRLVPGPVICMGVPLTMLVAWRERHALDLSGVRWAIAGRVPGTLAGSLVVALLATSSLAVLFAVALLVAVASSLGGWSVQPSSRNLFTAGVVSGAMGTSTSVGGPPLALVYQRSAGPELRATMAAFMAFGASFSLLVLVLVGEFGRTELALAAVLLPGVLVGFGLSRWTNRFLDRGYTRPAVLVFAAASAISILVRHLG